MLGGHGYGALCVIVEGFVFDGWDVPAPGVESFMVVPSDPFGSVSLDLAPVIPGRALEIDELTLVKPDR